MPADLARFLAHLARFLNVASTGQEARLGLRDLQLLRAAHFRQGYPGGSPGACTLAQIGRSSVLLILGLRIANSFQERATLGADATFLHELGDIQHFLTRACDRY